MQMQNDMPLNMYRSKSEPQIEYTYVKIEQEIKFQSGGRLFSETESSFTTALNWDISSKFGMRIDFHLLQQMPSLNLMPGVDFRHLENSI